MSKLPRIDDPDFWSWPGCVSLLGMFLSFIGVAAGVFYALQGFTRGLLLLTSSSCW